MAYNAQPAIACIGIIGKHASPPPLTTDNPLHISLFPPHQDEELDMSFILNSSLDIFDIRTRAKTLDQDLGLLHALDEAPRCLRLADQHGHQIHYCHRHDGASSRRRRQEEEPARGRIEGCRVEACLSGSANCLHQPTAQPLLHA
ncbi:hypothetical protein ABVK25_012379 [Lepraria finkii]|uniref:Uncharacterized protein n=1 Tax=Lepraria finkii TaxID=1340010 RepID=A0ABR4AI97_9LECA